MSENIQNAVDILFSSLRLKTSPVAVTFLKDKNAFPEKTRRPSTSLGKKITLCQAITMARQYGWTVGIAKDDLVCVPASIAFGFSEAANPASSLAKLFQEVRYSASEEAASRESNTLIKLEKGEYEGILFSPLQKAALEPDVILIYGNPAQMMRLFQSWTYKTGERVEGYFGGKVECTEYLIVPFKKKVPRVAIPGMGDRIFSMTQDEEMVYATPGSSFTDLLQGLREAGEKIGARYPIPFYVNFQPEFPKIFKELGKTIGVY